MTKNATQSDILRAALQTDPRPVTRIAREAGVNHAMLSRFVRGERGLTLSTVDQLCRVMPLGLRDLRQTG
ncbi:MAG: helix-turn-helix domain-containing protein [Planctomycetia bacterium]|jgi:plasmid maintenance system antidote protein VapI